MNEQLHIAGFAGSLRSQSYNRRLLEIAAELMPPGMRLEILDIDLPMYNPDLESQPLPEPVRRFREGVARADGLLIATPEYNHSIPAVLKHALEWLSRPLPDLPASGKLAAIMGAGGRVGTARAQTHLRQIAHSLNMLVLSRPEVLIANASAVFDEQGRLLDEAALGFIHQQMVALEAGVRFLQTRQSIGEMIRF